MQVPAFKYNQPSFDVYMERSPKLKMFRESEREAATKKAKHQKSDSPSPLSYQFVESYEKTQAVRSSCVKINKETKIPKFTGK